MEILLLGSLIGLMIFAKRCLPAPASFIPFLTVLALASSLYVGSLLGALFYVALFAYALGLSMLVGMPLMAFVASVRHANAPGAWSTARGLADQLARSPIGPPIGAFVVLYALGYVLFGWQPISEWDEFSWGIYSKIAVRHDDIFAHADISFADHPRLGSLFQYFFSQFIGGGGYDESAVILAQATIFAAGAAAFVTFGRVRFFAAPFICISFYFLVQVCIGRAVSSLYQDGFLGLCWAMSLMAYLANRRATDLRSLAATALALFCLVQIKPIGLLLALFTLFVVTIDSCVFRPSGSTNWRPLVHRVALLAAVVAGSHLSWSLAKTLGGIGEGQFVLDSGAVATLFEIEEWQRETVANFGDFVLYGGDPFVAEGVADEKAAQGLDWSTRRAMNDPSTFVAPFRPYLLFVGRVTVPLSIWLFVFGTFAIALCCAAPTSKYSRAELGVLLSLLAAVMVVYACVLCLLYVTVFEPRESVRLASVERYLGAALLGVFLVLFFLLLDTWHRATLAVFVAVTMAILPADAGIRWRQGMPWNTLRMENDELKSMIAPLVQELEMSGAEADVLLVGDEPFLGVRLTYWLFPARVNMAWPDHDGRSPKQLLHTGLDFARDLQDHDHLVIWKYDDFWEHHGEAVEAAGLRSTWQVEGRKLVRLPVRDREIRAINDDT